MVVFRDRTVVRVTLMVGVRVGVRVRVRVRVRVSVMAGGRGVWGFLYGV